MEQLEFKGMNTTIYIEVSNCVNSNWQEYIRHWFLYVEREWSRFREDNELAEVNNLLLNQELRINPFLLDILWQAEGYREKTNGLFNPYLKRQMEMNGYNRSFPFQSSLIENGLIEQPCLTSPFLIDRQKNTITRKGKGEIDLGGIAKGYAVEQAAKWLKKTGKAAFGIVDGGGDITVWSDGSKLWRIGVAHPMDQEKEVGQFSMYNGSIATSNSIYRSWKQGETVKHHILDGRTGLPVRSGIIQATVITTNCLDAEVTAKLLFILNQEKRAKCLPKINHEIQYLLVTEAEEIIKGWDVHE
nr:FAD:protein FMN transferase [uncultured Bacillus sp.]